MNDINERLMQIVAAKQGEAPRPPRNRFPRAVVACIHCGSALVATTQGLGVIADRYWRRHQCTGCKQTFVSGVPAVPGQGSTTDVLTMPTFFSAEERRELELQSEVDAKLDDLLNAPSPARAPVTHSSSEYE